MEPERRQTTCDETVQLRASSPIRIVSHHAFCWTYTLFRVVFMLLCRSAYLSIYFRNHGSAVMFKELIKQNANQNRSEEGPARKGCKRNETAKEGEGRDDGHAYEESFE